MEKPTTASRAPAPDRTLVVKKLLKSARLMEIQMDTLYKQGHYTTAECQFQIINGIYSRITPKEYKNNFTC
jgi:hypothetical protein